jgi:hypothetical protein
MAPGTAVCPVATECSLLVHVWCVTPILCDAHVRLVLTYGCSNVQEKGGVLVSPSVSKLAQCCGAGELYCLARCVLSCTRVRLCAAGGGSRTCSCCVTVIGGETAVAAPWPLRPGTTNDRHSQPYLVMVVFRLRAGDLA